MNKKTLEKLINLGLVTGADFAEIFYEDTKSKKYNLVDSNLDTIDTTYIKGVGIRLAKDNDIVYGYTNELDDDSLVNLVKKLSENFNSKQILFNIKLEEKEYCKKRVELNHNNFDNLKKKEYLINIDKIARKYDNKITQVEAKFYEYDQDVIIASSKGTISKDKRILTRLIINIIASKEGIQTQSSKTFGIGSGYELLDSVDIEKEVIELSKSAIDKLTAISSPSGEMPVVIAPGFGAVIFHEACGHAMEATSVANNVSILSGCLNKKVASDKVSIVDDGTILNEWGSTSIDDEGNSTRKNILIENGILKGYLIDELNNRKMNMEITGSGRRESYKYAPTSRMNNTYLLNGNDKIEDMIKSIDYGIYATNMGGGSVDPVTGDFNFAVNEAYLIEDGKVTKMVKGGSLIGNTKDILMNVEMVSDDLKLDTGYCGSKSGSVPVTIGQPTIKVSKILVGGE